MALILLEALNVQEDEGYRFLKTQHSLRSTLQFFFVKEQVIISANWV